MPEFNGTMGNDGISGSEDDDVINGGAGNDSLRGFGGNDQLNGEADHDLLNGGDGDDTLDGGSGLDRAGYFHTNAALGGVTVSLLLQGQAQDTVAAGWDTLFGIENVSGTPFADTLIGDAGNNWLWGSIATIAPDNVSTTNNDTIDGGAGNDTISVGIGNHTLAGGADTDTLRFTENGAAEPGVTISLGLQNQVQSTGAGNWYLSGFENLSGGTGNDTLTGDGNVNILAGNSGDDTLSGGGGDDALYGDGSFQLDVTSGGGSGAIVLYPDVQAAFGAASGNDTLVGGAGSDTIYGGGGSDFAQGGDGADTIYGGDGNDELYGGTSITSIPQPLDEADTIYGEAGNDVIRGGSGDDLLHGGEGDDNLRGDLGNDLMAGGNGRDFVSYRFDDSGVTSGVYFDAQNFAASASFTMSDGRGGTDSLTDVEHLGITGSAFDDVLIGSQFATSTATSTANTISGNGGNDEIYGGGQWDQLDGGAGNDLIFGFGGADGITGGIGNDALLGGGGNDFIDGGEGDDNLVGELGSDTIVGGAGHDFVGYSFNVAAITSGVTFDGTNFAATAHFTWADGRGGTDDITDVEALGVTGTAYDDILFGSQFTTSTPTLVANQLFGLGGNDQIYGGGQWDQLDGGAGNDLIFGFGGGDGISGGTGNDQLLGGDGDDFLDGGADDDNLVGGIGSDIILGGSGHDFVGYGFNDAGVTSGIVFDGTNFASTAHFTWSDGRGGTDDITDVEALGVSGSAYNDILVGSAFTTSTATLVANQLFGMGGDDQIFGAGQWDQLDGGAGNDLIDGGGGGDGISGGAGNDRLIGGGGDDFTDGGADVDYITGGAGNDIIVGGAGNDRAGYYHTNAAAGGVTVSLMVTTIQSVGGGQGDDTISEVEAISGTPFADMLTGDGGANWLWGSPATISTGNVSATNNDWLDGGGGNDLLTVGIGNHMLIGGSGNDTVRFTENGAAVEAALTVSLANQGRAQGTGNGSWTLTGVENLSGGTGGDRLTGDDQNNVLAGDLGNDMLTGGDGRDVLMGDGFINVDSDLVITRTYDQVGGGNDSLNGGKGDDFLYGGRGNDTMVGGQGVDRFVIQANSGADRLTDFALGVDKIVFDVGSGPDDYGDLIFTKSGNNVLISWGTTDSILVEAVKSNQLTAANFEFGAPVLPAAAEALSLKTATETPSFDFSLSFDHFSHHQSDLVAFRPESLFGF